jgi:hypothetical protein
MKTKVRINRHTWHVKVRSGYNGESTLKARARVKRWPKPFTLTLTAEHVRKSIELQGVGNTNTCAMAICSQSHADQFPFPFAGGVEWTYGRAWFASKYRNGLPIECYVMAHDDQIAQLNDTKGGQQKLLERLEKDGPITISLRPVPESMPMSARKKRVPSHKGNYDGSKTAKSVKGAKLRYATATLGGVPA